MRPHSRDLDAPMHDPHATTVKVTSFDGKRFIVKLPNVDLDRRLVTDPWFYRSRSEAERVVAAYRDPKATLRTHLALRVRWGVLTPAMAAYLYGFTP